MAPRSWNDSQWPLWLDDLLSFCIDVATGAN